MKHPPLLLCLAIAFGTSTSVSEGAEGELLPFIAEWRDLCVDITGVRVSCDIRDREPLWDEPKIATGKVGYLGPKQGFFQIDFAMNRRTNGESEHLRWLDGKITEIRHRDRIITTQSPPVKFLWWEFPLLERPDVVMPFLPGNPNESVLSDWSFSATKESESHIWISAMPKRDTAWGKHLRACQLYFEKSTKQLLAVKHYYPGSGTRIVQFSQVEVNPEPWQEPDFTRKDFLGYRVIDTTQNSAPASAKAK